MKAIDRIKDYYDQLGTLKIEVPELGEDGEPFVIYYKPMTGIEHRKILGSKHDADEIDLAVNLLIAKALDENSEPLFDKGDKPVLLRKLPRGLLFRISAVLSALPTLEQAEKN